MDTRLDKTGSTGDIIHSSHSTRWDVRTGSKGHEGSPLWLGDVGPFLETEHPAGSSGMGGISHGTMGRGGGDGAVESCGAGRLPASRLTGVRGLELLLLDQARPCLVLPFTLCKPVIYYLGRARF